MCHIQLLSSLYSRYCVCPINYRISTCHDSPANCITCPCIVWLSRFYNHFPPFCPWIHSLVNTCESISFCIFVCMCIDRVKGSLGSLGDSSLIQQLLHYRHFNVFYKENAFWEPDHALPSSQPKKHLQHRFKIQKQVHSIINKFWK